MILEKLRERRLPDVLTFADGQAVNRPELWPGRRDEILRLLRSEIYGFSPLPPEKITAVVQRRDDNAFAGKAVHTLVNVQFDTPKGEFSFPVNLIIPKTGHPVPAFLHIAFRPEIPDRYYPVEEIIDGGFAAVSFCYQDVAADMDDGFAGGLAGMYPRDPGRTDEWGKISMWAWAASRVMDYLQTLQEIDRDRIAVIGHSRLGKTALWCAAQDERFAVGISNESGCSGAAITRDKKGERVKQIIHNFSFWFCKNYQKYIDNEHNMPFDQHFLLAAIAPRLVYVCSAQEDEWADPESEFLSCAAATSVYKLLGLRGLVTEDCLPEPGTTLHEGEIGYHLRSGTHFLSRYDWQRYMEYLKKWVNH